MSWMPASPNFPEEVTLGHGSMFKIHFDDDGHAKKLRPKIYLAGPMSGLTYEGASSWRDWFVQNGKSRFQFISPLRGKEDLMFMDEEFTSHTYDTVLSNSRAVATRDRWDVTRADAVVVNVLAATKVSIGTMIEMGWADEARVPVVLVMEEEGNLHDHTIVRHIAGFQVENLLEALDTLRVLFT